MPWRHLLLLALVAIPRCHRRCFQTPLRPPGPNASGSRRLRRHPVASVCERPDGIPQRGSGQMFIMNDRYAICK